MNKWIELTEENKPVKFNIPQPNWQVAIPKGGEFTITFGELSWWQRMWMGFIGWDVKYIGEKK